MTQRTINQNRCVHCGSKYIEPIDNNFECYDCGELFSMTEHSKECIEYNYKYESDTKGECICEENEAIQ